LGHRTTSIQNRSITFPNAGRQCTRNVGRRWDPPQFRVSPDAFTEINHDMEDRVFAKMLEWSRPRHMELGDGGGAPRAQEWIQKRASRKVIHRHFAHHFASCNFIFISEDQNSYFCKCLHAYGSRVRRSNKDRHANVNGYPVPCDLPYAGCVQAAPIPPLEFTPRFRGLGMWTPGAELLALGRDINAMVLRCANLLRIAPH